MINEYVTVLKSIVHEDSEHDEAATWSKYVASGAYDWQTASNKEFCNDTGDLDWLEYDVKWKFGNNWMESMKRVQDSLKADCGIKGAYPSGSSSYPVGPPLHRTKSVDIGRNRRQQAQIEKSWDHWRSSEIFQTDLPKFKPWHTGRMEGFEPLNGDTDDESD